MSTFTMAVKNEAETSGCRERCFRAINFLIELEKAKTKYYKDRQGRRFHACLTLVAAAALVGPDLKVLSSWTGIPKAFVFSVAQRMHSAALWSGDSKEIDEWRGTESDFMSTVFSHASVAVGHTGREIDGNGAISYFDRA